MADQSITVLVADGNAADRAILVDALRKAGYAVLQAVDGGSALKVVNEHPVRIAIVCDRMTPHTGIEFAQQALLRGEPLGVIMTTGDAPADLLLEAGRLGISHVVKKPADPARVVKMVARLAGSP